MVLTIKCESNHDVIKPFNIEGTNWKNRCKISNGESTTLSNEYYSHTICRILKL